VFNKYLKMALFAAFIFTATVISTPSADAAQAHPPGTLIRINSTIWRISEDGLSKNAIDSLEKFQSHRFSFTNVVDANSADLALADGGFLSWGEGVLFEDGGVTYQVVNGKKHGFISANVFLEQGFSFSMIKKGNLNNIPEGEAIRSGQTKHLNGTLVKDATGTIWKQTANGLAPFPSQAVFFSHGGTFSEVVNINAADLSTNRTAVLSYRTGTLVNDNGTIWAVRATSKAGFPSASCFLGFGYSFGMVLSGSTGHLNPIGSICGDFSGPNPIGPVSSYTEQGVVTANGTFSARIANFDLASGKIRVVTDSATDRDCADDCSVASLQAFVNANASQSGINGTYFCPQDYAECGSQTNAFFWKLIDTSRGVMVNRNNGLGELDPFMAFDAGGKATYFSRWIDFINSNYQAVAGINSYAMIENGKVSLNYSKLDSKQQTTKSTRAAIGLKGQTLYLIHVLNATIPDTTLVLQNLGLDHAIGLDGGGSSALMYQKAYKSGPGRNIPNAILVRELP
jgi:hypothetical protein